jgi:uncharacterized membrane protein YidH (DUF202 family)
MTALAFIAAGIALIALGTIVRGYATFCKRNPEA